MALEEEVWLCIAISIMVFCYLMLQMLECQWSYSVAFLLHDSCSFPPLFCPPKWLHFFLPVDFATIDRDTKDVTVLYRCDDKRPGQQQQQQQQQHHVVNFATI
ncbi:hypothetical protein SOVF_094690 [Spinacia oleracea]|nr:hypothetical protein SOVF_094690 [Spinacia oleracea]